MDSQGSQSTKKRRLDDGNEASQAGKDGGSSLGLSRGGFRPRTIEFDHEASCSESVSHFTLEIWATDAEGVEHKIGNIRDGRKYTGAEKVKVIAKDGDTPQLADPSYLQVFERQEEEKARQEEKKALREKTLALEALQARRRALQESERALQYEEDALQEKIKFLQEKQTSHVESEPWVVMMISDADAKVWHSHTPTPAPGVW
ncbi:hypothetical protein HER10_EVM0007059 [Colletotrichum scovillei]|uniref:uncharacterized protein n=1 Tax=Colletotrichum scovillei TaxID=1209932 RepID=UPI0015C35194|nr:uncharacterized protein HER10_EVM0007059 [Colletotrichum scovillei]KAF4783181.1 hypothetical protein HER10_EVM0007059 [Colletotrichum scovillei]